MERTQEQIRQYENRGKILDRKIAIEQRKDQKHRLCSRGSDFESFVPKLIAMSDEEAKKFLYAAS